MNKVINIPTVLGCVLSLLLTGCFFGDRVPASRTVSFRFPAPSRLQTGLSVNDKQVQEALQVIDTVLTADGLARDPNSPTANEPDLVATYAGYNSTGQQAVGGPSVYFRGNRLEVVVIDGGNMNAPLSEATKKICDSLKKELSSRYGTKMVEVE
jgi:hypothetical protein